MSSKKLREYNSSFINGNEVSKDLLSIEEQQAFIDNMVSRLRNNRKELEDWIKNFKKDHGITDGTFRDKKNK